MIFLNEPPNENSSFDSDFEKYHRVFESDEQWNLKKAFLDFYEDEILEDELISIAEVFMNTEIKGCKYPIEVADRVEQLACKVAEVQNYREVRRDRALEGAASLMQSKHKETTGSCPVEDWKLQDYDEIMSVVRPKILFFDEKPNILRRLLKNVIYFEIPNNIDASLEKTKALMKKIGKITVGFTNGKCFYNFNGQVVGHGAGSSKREAEDAAEDNFLQNLKDNCFSVVQQETQEIDEIAKVVEVIGGEIIDRIDNISMQMKITRGDLINKKTNKLDLTRLHRIFSTFQRIETEYDLAFDNEFSKEECAVIVQTAQAMKLRHKTLSRAKTRNIVVLTKLSSQVLRQKLLEGDQRWLRKYEIVAPPPKKKIDKKAWKKIDLRTQRLFRLRHLFQKLQGPMI